MHLCLALSLVHILSTAISWAQTPEPSLLIATEHNERTFHLGERIPLHLVFLNPEGQVDWVDREPCASRVCGKAESFRVQPATGWSDPLAVYFAQDFPQSWSGAEPGPPTTPLQVWVDLNEWVRFDRPGDYTVTITSRRVTPSVSGSIRLQIIPASPEWQNEKLQRIRSVRPPYSREWFEAEDDLSDLATPSAVEEMVARLRAEINRNIGFTQCTMCMGIIALPEPMREIAIASMNRRIGDPDFPISPVFFETMALLHDTWDSDCGKFLRPPCHYEANLWLSINSSLGTKRAKVRAETLETLKEVGPCIDDSRVKARLKSPLKATCLIPE
jgi:hypothetical protein